MYVFHRRHCLLMTAAIMQLCSPSVLTLWFASNTCTSTLHVAFGTVFSSQARGILYHITWKYLLNCVVIVYINNKNMNFLKTVSLLNPISVKVIWVSLFCSHNSTKNNGEIQFTHKKGKKNHGHPRDIEMSMLKNAFW